jgi:hypothetical protein
MLAAALAAERACRAGCGTLTGAVPRRSRGQHLAGNIFTEEEAMTNSYRWTRRILLFACFVGCFGCNPLEALFFIRGESRQPASMMKLTNTKEPDKEVKVAIVVSGRLDARHELLNANRDLAQKTTDQLRKLTEAHGEHLTVIEPRKVEQYLANHPNWKDQDPDDLAAELKERFKVDYVIDIEITSLSLYEKGAQQLFKGKAALLLKLLNANNPDEVPPNKEIHEQYPDQIEAYTPADADTNIYEFRSEFLDILAKDIAYCFCEHPTINQMDKKRKNLAD